MCSPSTPSNTKQRSAPSWREQQSAPRLIANAPQGSKCSASRARTSSGISGSHRREVRAHHDVGGRSAQRSVALAYGSLVAKRDARPSKTLHGDSHEGCVSEGQGRSVVNRSMHGGKPELSHSGEPDVTTGERVEERFECGVAVVEKARASTMAPARSTSLHATRWWCSNTAHVDTRNRGVKALRSRTYDERNAVSCTRQHRGALAKRARGEARLGCVGDDSWELSVGDRPRVALANAPWQQWYRRSLGFFHADLGCRSQRCGPATPSDRTRRAHTSKAPPSSCAQKSSP